jgi:hypothetical protein
MSAAKNNLNYLMLSIKPWVIFSTTNFVREEKS